MIKDIGFPFVAGSGARTLRDQGEGRLHILLLDTTRAGPTASITATGRGLLVVLMLVLVLVVLLWWLRLLLMLQVVSITRRIRDGVG